MIKNISIILSEECKLDATRPVVLGVSGGPDSMCLLDVLHKARVPLLVACLNHGLRSEAVAEIEYVRNLAAAFGVQFTTKTVDTQNFAEKAGLSVEAAARQLRYDFLFDEAVRINAQAVAVGHTADDQAETILMHLLRGSGLRGLKGMEFRSWLTHWSSEIPLVRPLLTTWRSEIMDYCQQNRLITFQDATNQSQDFFRNQLRLDVLPYLARYQPNIRQNLVRMAEILSADHDLLHSLVQDAWQTCLVEDGDRYVAFQRAKVNELPVSFQRHLLHQAMLMKRAGVQDIEFAMIERARHSLKQAAGSQTFDLGAGLQLRIEQDTAWIVGREVRLPGGQWPAVLTDQVIELPIPGCTEFGDGWVLQAVLMDVGAYQAQNLDTGYDLYQAFFDASRLVLPLRVRRRIPGDRLQPAGMGGKSVKISDLMINLKLPKRSRANWPMICSGGDIIWVPGCRQSQLALPCESTQQVARLCIFHPVENEVDI